MQFDLVIANPPFQDSTNRGKTPHKLWIDFTKLAFESLLKKGGYLHQVSPASFQSPSNKVLGLFKTYRTDYIDLRTSKYFPEVGSSFAHYLVCNEKDFNEETHIFSELGEMKVRLDQKVFYLPNDLCKESLSIHKKVIFHSEIKLDVKFDYVTCHNIRLRTDKSLSTTETKVHKYKVFHTNRQIWFSSKIQDFANKPKVMWTRSGYSKPFFDPGTMGGTDLVYYVLVRDKKEGLILESQMNSLLFKYIFKTAKWSGFGNDKVFAALPRIPENVKNDDEIFDFFKFTKAEVNYVKKFMG
jgi:hypothetical protein